MDKSTTLAVLDRARPKVNRVKTARRSRSSLTPGVHAVSGPHGLSGKGSSRRYAQRRNGEPWMS